MNLVQGPSSTSSLVSVSVVINTLNMQDLKKRTVLDILIYFLMLQVSLLLSEVICLGVCDTFSPRLLCLIVRMILLFLFSNIF